MSRVRTEIDVLEVDGKVVDRNAKELPMLVIESDWRASGSQIKLTIGGSTYIVAASHMLAGVHNATNRG